MKKNRIKAYWLLLLVLLYTAGAVLSVGEAQARYVTTATWNTVVQQEESAVTSDCLEDVSKAPLTILLGSMKQEPYPVEFQLTAGEATSGSLNWTVEQSVDQPDYLTVEMHIGDTVITPETTIDIAAGDTVIVVMTLTPSETAFTEVREAVNVYVTVTWADTLQGTFLTQLPAVEEEATEPTEPPTEATEPSTDVTEPPTDVTEPPTDVTEPPADVTEPPTDVTEPPTDVTEPPTDVTEPPTEATEPPTEATEPPTEATESPTEATEPDPADPGTGVSALHPTGLLNKLLENPGTRLTPNSETTDEETIPEEETTEPVTETGPAAETEPVTETEPTTPDEPVGQTDDPSEPENPEDPTESSEDPTEATEPVQAEIPVMTVDLTVDSPVNSADALPVQITAPENGGTVRLGLALVMEPTDPEGESQTVLNNFPKYTRFSLTDGTSYYMLYCADTIVLNSEAGETLSVLLDLSYVDLEQPQVVLGAAVQGQEAPISTCTATVIPEPTRHTSLSSRIMSKGMPLEVTIGGYDPEYTLEYVVEMLTTTESEDGETGVVAYVPVELAEDSLWAELISDEAGTKLIFTIGETLPPAGTYRVSLNWTFEEVCYAETQEIFFINYLTYTEYEKTGGAEQ